MSSHDSTMAHQGQVTDRLTISAGTPADLASRGPTARRTVLRRLEARLAESGLRGHIYLTERAVVEFATRQTRADRPLDRNVGPEPVRRALGEILRPEQEPQSWLRRLHAQAAGRTRAPAPALWNSPALVVTGAMASRVLCAALEHEADYPAETIDGLMQEADVGENEAAAMFEDVTGKPLRPG